MRFIISISSFMLLCIAVSSCSTTVRTPGATIKARDYEVEVKGDRHGVHCPPGHAKKNWC